MSKEYISESFWAMGIMLAVIIGIIAVTKYEGEKQQQQFIIDSLNIVHESPIEK